MTDVVAEEPAKTAPPIMDVAPAPRPAPAASNEPAAKPAAVTPKDVAAPKPVRPATAHQAPVLAVILAVIFFLALSSLAYYAYTKGS